MTTHSSIRAWKILWTEEPGGLLSMNSQESDTATKPPPSHVCGQFWSRGNQDSLYTDLLARFGISLVKKNKQSHISEEHGTYNMCVLFAVV